MIEEPIDGVETESTPFEESIADTATISLRDRLRSRARRTTP